MSRFKFRAWHKESGVMIPWGHLSLLIDGDRHRVHMVPRMAPMRFPEAAVDTMQVFEIRACNFFAHPELHVMQWTGKQDFASQDIYEGDVIHVRGYNPDLYAIRFLDAGFCATHPGLSGYPIDLNHFRQEDIRVQGHIYDTQGFL